MRYIELLSPAKDYDTARAAVDHGADAIYMGAARFGARRAAANSLEDVARTVEYAHQYGVRVHSTLNTVLYDEELSDAEQMARIDTSWYDLTRRCPLLGKMRFFTRYFGASSDIGGYTSHTRGYDG